MLLLTALGASVATTSPNDRWLGKERRRPYAMFEQLDRRVIEPRGDVWASGVKAVALAQQPPGPADIERGCAYWETPVA